MSSWLRQSFEAENVNEAYDALLWRPELADKYPKLIEMLIEEPLHCYDLLRVQPQLADKYPQLVDAMTGNLWDCYYVLLDMPEFPQRTKLVQAIAHNAEVSWELLKEIPRWAELYPELVAKVATSLKYSFNLLRYQPQLAETCPKLVEAVAADSFYAAHLLIESPRLAAGPTLVLIKAVSNSPSGTSHAGWVWQDRPDLRPLLEKYQ